MFKKNIIFHAWFIWILGAIFFFYKYVIEVSPSVMTDDLMSTFNIGGAELGNLASSYFYAYFLMQIPVGLLIDRYGPRKITSIAILLCGLGALFFSKALNFEIAIFSRFIIGLGAAFAAINVLKLIANWFPTKWFAFMTGLSMSIAMLGAAGGENPLANIIKNYGWRTSLFSIGIVGIILAIVFFIFVRDYPKNPINVSTTKKKHRFVLGLKQILKNPQNWLIAVYSGLAFAPVSVFGGLWGVPFIEKAYDLSKESAALSVSFIYIGFAIGAPFFGWLSNYYGKRKPIMFIGTILALLFILLIIYFTSIPKEFLFIFSFLFGFFISSFLICFTVIHEYNLPIVTATAIGVMNTFDAFFGAISDPIIGKFLDLRWTGQMLNGARVFSQSDYKWSLIMLPIYLIIALICLYFSKETNCIQKQ